MASQCSMVRILPTYDAELDVRARSSASACSDAAKASSSQLGGASHAAESSTRSPSCPPRPSSNAHCRASAIVATARTRAACG
eukprot:327492-Prymnesium_polylepis.1